MELTRTCLSNLRRNLEDRLGMQLEIKVEINHTESMLEGLGPMVQSTPLKFLL